MRRQTVVYITSFSYHFFVVCSFVPFVCAFSSFSLDVLRCVFFLLRPVSRVCKFFILTNSHLAVLCFSCFFLSLSLSVSFFLANKFISTVLLLRIVAIGQFSIRYVEFALSSSSIKHSTQRRKNKNNDEFEFDIECGRLESC